MNTKRFILAGCAVVMLSASSAMAGPCDTGRAANLKDAGSGPASMGSGQTTGMATDPKEHPPTDTMNCATGDVATSSQDTQKQMQGQPTAAQEAQGAKPDAKRADKDAGSGPASTGSGQTTGMAADTSQHPPTSTINRKTDEVAASSQDRKSRCKASRRRRRRPKGPSRTKDSSCYGRGLLRARPKGKRAGSAVNLRPITGEGGDAVSRRRGICGRWFDITDFIRRDVQHGQGRQLTSR